MLHDVLIEAMENLDIYQEEPMVGIFWFDTFKNELFGVNSSFAEDNQYYKSNLFNIGVKTDKRLHKNIWKKESYRGRDKRFKGDHTLIPRGRVFQFEDGRFKICVGSWIDKYPEAVKLIKDEFNLPDEYTDILKDVHWNIGHGFSQEEF